jgi:hypothetical protein
VLALQQPGALEIAAGLGVPVCLMHMQGGPRTMQESPHYADVVSEVSNFLLSRVLACRAAGIPGNGSSLPIVRASPFVQVRRSPEHGATTSSSEADRGETLSEILA